MDFFDCTVEETETQRCNLNDKNYTASNWLEFWYVEL